MGTRVYVGNLNSKVKKEDLEGEFTKYGKLNSVWVAFNPPGFAFVEFENRDEAEKACDILNGTEVLGSQLRVEISKGRPRQSRRGAPGGGSNGTRRFGSEGGGPSDFRRGRPPTGGFRTGGGGGGFAGGRNNGAGPGGYRPRGPLGSSGGARSYPDSGFGGSRNGGGFGGGRDGGGYGGNRDGGRNFGNGGGGFGRNAGSGGGGRFRSRSPTGARTRF